MQSDQKIEEGIGGGSASPVFTFSIQNAGEPDHPWKGALGEGTTTAAASTTKGRIFDALYSIDEIDPTLTIQNMGDDDLMCLEYTYETEAVKNIVVAKADYEPFTETEDEPPVLLTVVQPLYKVVLKGGALEIEQTARNNYALTEICKDGKILKFFLAQ
jgi:hypothetical protein